MQPGVADLAAIYPPCISGYNIGPGPYITTDDSTSVGHVGYACFVNHLALPGWVKHTWEALSGTPLVLWGPSLAIPHQGQHDIHLMDAFVDQNFSTPILLRLNECSLFLHATTLADITMADGTTLNANAWHGCCSHSQWYCQDTWISTHNLGQQHWRLWQLVL